MKRVIIAATLLAAWWAIRRWRDQRYALSGDSHRGPTDSWENEGGALAPTASELQTAQVPR